MRTSLMIFAGLVLLMAVGTVQADYPIDYTVEANENCIKFEDAVYYDAQLDEYVDAGLGEEGVIETDEFIVVLDEECYDVTVCLKSGTCDGCVTFESLQAGALYGIVGCGVTIVISTDDGIEYYIEVTSDGENETAALSYIELCFCEDTTVVDWAYNPNRSSPNTAPGVEEEEEEEEEDID
jgi:hypothetical protein